MTPDLEQVAFHRVVPPPGVPVGPYDRQVWDLYWHTGRAFAQAEVFPAPEHWTVKLRDRAPEVDPAELVRLVGRLLLWHVGSRADTVQVVLGRRPMEPQTLVLVGGEYV